MEQVVSFVADHAIFMLLVAFMVTVAIWLHESDFRKGRK
jgi:hypothetical protein